MSPRVFDPEHGQTLLDRVQEEAARPLSLKEIGLKLGYDPSFLRDRLPEQCHLISARYRTYTDNQRREKVKQACEEVKIIVAKLCNGGIKPTRNNVSKRMSKPAYFRDREVLEAWKAIRLELRR
ncbi:MAG: hypothetical protein Kow00121_05740 [Elainellaceae cyanobacterium]